MDLRNERSYGKGRLVASAADCWDVLAPGPDGTVLTTDHTAPLGVAWAAPSGGGGGATPGGSDGQVQVNVGGALAGLRGTAATADLNGSTDAVAIGSGSWALGEQSLAVGYQCIASTDQSVAMGYQCTAGARPRPCTISGATVTIPGGDYTGWFYGFDDGALVLSQLSGGSGPAIAYGSIDGTADGGGVVFSGGHTVLTLTAAVTTHAVGHASMRDFDIQASAVGSQCTASSYTSHAEGNTTVASANASHAEGSGTTASGTAAHAEGSGTTASGTGTHAEGYQATASGFAAHAEGYQTTASDFAAHAEGYQTTASAFPAHAEGSGTTASGTASHAGGNGATASLPCQWARSDGTAIPGQRSEVYASGQTAGASPVALRIGTTDAIAIAANRAVGFVASIAAYKIDGSKAAFFVRQGLVTNVGGTVSLVGSVGTTGTDINANGWSVAITADDANDALAVTVTGEATVNWRACINFTEVGV